GFPANAMNNDPPHFDFANETSLCAAEMQRTGARSRCVAQQPLSKLAALVFHRRAVIFVPAQLASSTRPKVQFDHFVRLLRDELLDRAHREDRAGADE